MTIDEKAVLRRFGAWGLERYRRNPSEFCAWIKKQQLQAERRKRLMLCWTCFLAAVILCGYGILLWQYRR